MPLQDSKTGASPVTIDTPVLAAIRRRRHVGALAQTQPGPDAAQLAAILEAGAAAPDHGKIAPFRFTVIEPAQRAAYIAASLAAFREAIPDADEVGLAKAKAKAEQAPVVVALIAALQPDHPKIGLPDQWLTAGCVLQNMWLAAESLGFHCGVSSGRLLETSELRRAFGLQGAEQLVSILSIGTAKEPQVPRPKPDVQGLMKPFAG
jgi:nitroreductase